MDTMTVWMAVMNPTVVNCIYIIIVVFFIYPWPWGPGFPVAIVKQVQASVP